MHSKYDNCIHKVGAEIIHTIDVGTQHILLVSEYNTYCGREDTTHSVGVRTQYILWT